MSLLQHNTSDILLRLYQQHPRKLKDSQELGKKYHFLNKYLKCYYILPEFAEKQTSSNARNFTIFKLTSKHSIFSKFRIAYLQQNNRNVCFLCSLQPLHFYNWKFQKKNYKFIKKKKIFFRIYLRNFSIYFFYDFQQAFF